MIELLNSILSEQLSYAVSWTVLHSLWQASLIALIMSWYLHVCKHDEAIIRYRITYASLFFVFISAICTFGYYFLTYGGTTEVVIQQVLLSRNTAAAITQEEVSVLSSVSTWFSGNFTLIASMWAMGAMLFSLKFGGSFLFANSLKWNTSSILPDSVFTQLLKLKREIGVNRYVRIAESAKVNTPVLIGCLKPVILFPVGLINQLSVEETNAILAHELAHIKRNDFIHNLFISVLETLFYYHPAVWWISANLRLERENCCDDLAVKTIGDKAIYAKTLVKIETLKNTKIPSLAIPMARNNNQLLHRISRIVNQPQTRSQIRERLIAVVLLFTFFFGFAYSPETDTRSIAIAPEVETKQASLLKPDCQAQNTLIAKLAASNQKQDCNCDKKVQQEVKVNVISNQTDDRDVIYIDTIPTSKKSNMTIITSSDDQEVILKMKDGKITELSIDGEEIDESEYEDHLEHENLDVEDIIEKATESFKDISIDQKFHIEELHEGINDLKLQLHSGDFFDFDNLDSLIDSDGIIKWNFDGHADHMPVWEELELKLQNLQGNHLKLVDSLGDLNDSIFSGIFEMHSDFPNHFYHFDIPKEGLDFEFKEPSKLFERHVRPSTPTDVLLSELNKDGFIPKNGKHKIELTGKHLKINGQKQPANIFNKYKKIFEKELGHELSKDSKIKIEADQKEIKANESKRKRAVWKL